jgi:preprotein translocase subunit SecG
MMETMILSPDSLVMAGAVNEILIYTFRTLFFLSAILLMVIVLLQEGKGGGLASALGGQGAETFGVSTGGVNKVTLFLAGLFLLSGLAHALAFGQPVSKSLTDGEGSGDSALPLDEGNGDGGGMEDLGPVDGGGEEPGGDTEPPGNGDE